MMRLFIVDDEAPARARLKTLLADIAAECPHELAGEAGNATEAIERIAATLPDIVLLDVQMPETSGIELATSLAQLPQPPAIVFVTAFDQYAINAFDLQAADYLLKPVRAERLAQALLRAVGQRARKAGKPAGRQHFSVLERGRLLLVPVTEVIYLKAELKYLTLHTRERDYLIEESLASIEEELPSVFVRVHRNALVAKNAIAGVERGLQVSAPDGREERVQEAWEVILKGSAERLPVSRRQWPLVKALVR